MGCSSSSQYLIGFYSVFCGTEVFLSSLLGSLNLTPGKEHEKLLSQICAAFSLSPISTLTQSNTVLSNCMIQDLCIFLPS